MELDLQTKVGQLVVFGFDGFEINEHVKKAIREYKIGNVILFTRNFKNSKQLFQLIQALQAEALRHIGIPLLICIDQEGGTVTRLTSDFTWFPGPMATRAAGEVAFAEQVGEGIGAEMQAYGLNLNLAPVVNLADNPDSPHIGSRSFAAKPAAGAPYAKAHITGLQRHVLATAKHFPSIGGSRVDLHHALGRNESTLASLLDVEMAPVRHAVEGGVEAVMTSHQIYPAVEDCPATLSPKMINGWLRKEYGFSGIVISDCMEMKALADYLPTPEGCVQGVLAGVDLFLVCHTEKTQIQTAKALKEAILTKRISEERLNESVKRILRAKERFVKTDLQPTDPAANPLFVRNRRLAQEIAEKALTVVGDEGFFTLQAADRVFLAAPSPSEVATVDSMVDRSKAGKLDLVAAAEARLPQLKGLSYSLPLTAEERSFYKEALKAGGYNKVIVGLYNAHLSEEQRWMLQEAFAAKASVGVITLRSPFDLRWCQATTASLVSYEYTPPMVQAIVALLNGEIKAQGKLPEDVKEIFAQSVSIG